MSQRIWLTQSSPLPNNQGWEFNWETPIWMKQRGTYWSMIMTFSSWNRQLILKRGPSWTKRAWINKKGPYSWKMTYSWKRAGFSPSVSFHSIWPEIWTSPDTWLNETGPYSITTCPIYFKQFNFLKKWSRHSDLYLNKKSRPLAKRKEYLLQNNLSILHSTSYQTCYVFCVWKTWHTTEKRGSSSWQY